MLASLKQEDNTASPINSPAVLVQEFRGRVLQCYIGDQLVDSEWKSCDGITASGFDVLEQADTLE